MIDCCQPSLTGLHPTSYPFPPINRWAINVRPFHGLKTQSLLDLVEQDNPLQFDQSLHHPFYAYKVKTLLTDIALGMTPAALWKGTYDATGGYIIVKADGDILCYHIYNKNAFEDYLLANTRFDTPSTTRYGFARVYEENGRQFFKLNLQIRFL